MGIKGDVDGFYIYGYGMRRAIYLQMMNKDYNDFSAIDFIEDPFFRQWINENTPETARFWASFMTSHPEKIEAIVQARETLLIMKDLPERTVSPRLAGQADDIRRNIDKAIHYPLLRATGFEAGPAKTDRSPGARALTVRRVGIAASLLIGIASLVAVVLSRTYQKGHLPETQTVVQTSPKGKRSLINLPDGSTVWLNAESQLVYSRDFCSGDTREVFLVGEGFFDVADDALKPFIVVTSSIAIKVYGTAFNVRSYDNDKTVETTLVTGKIGISMINGEGSNRNHIETALLPNQQAVYVKKTKKLVLQNNIDAEVYSEWRAGKLYFDDKPVAEVLAILERWYNVTIHLEVVPPDRCTFSAKIDNKTLREVLELFKTSTDDSMAYRIQDNEVYITGKLCE